MKDRLINVLLVILLLSLPLSLFAGTVTGKITEASTNDVLPGANVSIEGTRMGAASGTNGVYTISNVPAGTHTLVISFMGYESQKTEVTVQAGAKATADFVLEAEVLLGQEISILADRAKERKTPVAFSNVSKTEIEARLGSRDIPLVLNATPSVYSTAQGGGAGDARINVRGFNQRNVAIMINGVPVNDMENGWVYWSNWDGLGDATSSIQMQRGLSAVNLATPSIGGTMNIISDPSAAAAGASFKQEFGNDGFLKTTFSAATGNTNDKYSVMGTVVRKTGNGLIDGTWTDAWAYYLGMGYQINKSNRLEFYAMGAPQRHGQSLYKQNIGAYSHEYAGGLEDYDPAALEKFPEAASGRKYNQNYNTISGNYASQGKQYFYGRLNSRYSNSFINERENFFHKPLINLNWYSKLSSKVNLFSTLYWSGGTGGGTGTIGSMGWDYSGPSRIVDWDATIERNKANATGARGILRNSVNNQWTVGLISKVNYKPTKGLDINAGIDWRKAEIEHYREVRDLLGGSYYIPYSSDQSDFWTGSQNERGLGDKVAYDNTNTVDWIGFFGQAEYTMGRLSAYGMAGYSTIKYGFTDHFGDNGTGTEIVLNSDNIGGYQVKGGAQYNITDKLGAYANAGLVSKVPIFDSVIDDYNSVYADNPENEKFSSFELGVNWFSKKVTAKVSYYYTDWKDRALYRTILQEDGSSARIFLTGMNQLHSGLEFEGAYQPINWFRLDLAGSVGNWSYQNDVSGQYKDFDDPERPDITETLYINGLKVGDAPQTQVAIGASFFPVKGLFLQGSYRYYASHYADFNPEDRTTSDDRAESWLTPTYGIVDLHAKYKLPFQLGGLDLSIFAHVFNALDEVFVQDAVDNSAYNAYRLKDESGKKYIVNPHMADAAEVFLGLPRMFNVGLQLNY